MKIKILIPIYNDWQSVFKLLENINSEVSTLKDEFSIIIVNDASTENKPEFTNNLKNLKSVQVINMKNNKGHARCNAAGLKYINEKEEFDYVIPMDGDGEDRPEELSLFIEKIKSFPKQVVTGNRIKRSEGFIFKVCYILHKYLTLVFTGQNIKFGNYTCLPKYAVNKMVNDGATWSSFSGSLTKLISSRETIASVRGSRYFGPSKMSFINLIMHSLSIIAVFKKTVMARSVIFLFVYFFLIYNSLSFITLIPIFSIIVFIYFIFSLSKRENLDHLNNSLKNIASIEDIS
tara:strand:+ start:114 stop:983 length:870 start_codon:yes stop_codon:yes gene_type:complete